MPAEAPAEAPAEGPAEVKSRVEVDGEQDVSQGTSGAEGIWVFLQFRRSDNFGLVNRITSRRKSSVCFSL